MRLKFLPSFVKRKGRITKKQLTSLNHLRNYSVSNIEDIVADSAKYKKCILEIGFGNAENLISQALTNPEFLYVGSEVYMSGIGTLISNLKEQKILNVRIFPNDIRQLLDQESSEVFDFIYIICPDPWPKDRHHKRRLIDSNFLKMLNNFMKKNAQLYISTDWENYAESILCSINEDNLFMETNKKYLNNVAHSKFERKGHEEGRKIFKFNYEKIL